MAAIRGLDTENSHDFSDLYKEPRTHPSGEVVFVRVCLTS